MNHKLFSITFLLSLIITLNSCNTGSGALKNNDETKISEFTEQEYTLPQKLKYTKVTGSFIADEFRPIGTSESGNFAYITVYADEACGCLMFDTRITDSNDKTLWLHSYNDDGEGITIEKAWASLYPEIKAELTKAEIVQQKKMKIKSNRFSINNINYEIILNIERKNDPEYEIEFVGKSEIYVNSLNSGKQKAAEFIYEYPYIILNATISGVILSPNKKNIQIIYKEERMGYEGPGHVINFFVINYEFQNN